jgi:hypothetical protein
MLPFLQIQAGGANDEEWLKEGGDRIREVYIRFAMKKFAAG